MDQDQKSSLPNPWYLIGWVVLAGMVVVLALTVLGAPSYMPEFAFAGIVAAAWSLLSLGAIQLYRRINGQRHQPREKAR